MKTRAIGKSFFLKSGLHRYKMQAIAQGNNNCVGCFFEDSKGQCMQHIKTLGACYWDERTDETNVVFIKLK